jgi:hypothetical protein
VIVNQAGDSLRGEITVPRSDTNPRFVDFTQGGTTTRYRADQLKYFRIGDEASYIGFIGDIDKSPVKLSEFVDGTITAGTVRDTVLLSIVILGKLSLYRLMDGRSNIHYFVGEKGNVSELILRVRRVEKPGGYGLMTSEVYKSQLRKMITDCSQAEPWIDKTEYRESSLSKLISKYNSCHQETPTYVQKQSRPHLVIGLSGGVVMSSLNNLTAGQSPGATGATYNGSTRPAGGLTVEILAPRMLKKFSIINEVLVHGVNFVREDPGPASAYFFELDYLRYNLGGRRYFGGEKLKPYVQVGVGAGRAYRTSYFSGNPVQSSFKPSKKDYAAHMGAGLKYGRFGFHARYERSVGFSEIIYFTPRVNNIFTMFTIDLNKPKE